MNELILQDLQHVFDAQAACRWVSVLSGQDIFLTGATGFVGAWILEALQFLRTQHGLKARIHVLSRDPERFLNAYPHFKDYGLDFLTGDILGFEAPAGLSCGYFIHGATIVDETPLAQRIIREGTENALRLAGQMGARRFLFLSSGAVYGPQPAERERIPETYLSSGLSSGVVDLTPYGAAKRAAENACLAEVRDGAGEFEVTIARIFALAGPYFQLDRRFALGNFIRDGLRARPIVVSGDGTAQRSYLYAADLAYWLLAIWLDGEPLAAYNVGSETPITIGALAKRLGQRFDVPVQISKSPVPGAAPELYVPDTAKARKELGLKEVFSLDQALERMIEWNRI